MAQRDDGTKDPTQTLDRAVFGTYFVGAVVPLVCLAVVTQRFALPAMGEDVAATWTVIGGISTVTLLSLSAFLYLRRLIRLALRRMEADNVRLAEILKASRTLSSAPHSHVVAETMAQCALTLTDAKAAFVLLQSSADKSLSLCESAGRNASALYQSAAPELEDLIEHARGSGSPSLLSAREAGADSGFSLAVVVPFGGDGAVEGALLLLHTAADAQIESPELDALATLATLGSVALRTADLQDAQRNFFTHVTEILVAALDAHVDHREGHGQSVAQVSNRIGRALMLTDERMQCLHFASLLHDIGMLKVPRAQRQNHLQSQKHPVLGHRMLSHIRLWGDVAPVVLYHHEHFDGSGYPDGLAGAQIPMEARIVHAADAFDLLLRGEGSPEPLSPAQAVRALQEESGSRFDPEVVAALRGIIERGELG